jgi:hypothetical protein
MCGFLAISSRRRNRGKGAGCRREEGERLQERLQEQLIQAARRPVVR